MTEDGFTQSVHVADRYWRDSEGRRSQVYDQTYHLGSYMYLDPAELDSADYEFSLQATPTDAHGMGMMFRYQDGDNYYRISFSPRWSFTRFEKKVNGNFETIAVTSNGYGVGETLDIRVVAKGPVVMVRVGDSQGNEAMFGHSDSALATGTVALYAEGAAAFGGLSLNAAPDTPEIVIAHPTTNTVSMQARVLANAQAINVPEDGYVTFSLNDGQPVTRVAPPYVAEFPATAGQTHSLEARLYDGADVELSRARVENLVVGDYFLAVGNGITNGSGDFYAADNVSADGRVVGVQGYQAKLADLLAEHTGVPAVVFNEGLPSQTAREATRNWPSLLERHRRSPLRAHFANPGEVSELLISLGTSDSYPTRPLPSGRELQPGDEGYESSFRRYMQDLVGTLTQYRPVSVSRVMPVVGAADADITTGGRYTQAEALVAEQNLLIMEYNEVIEDLSDFAGNRADVSEQLDIGPDLFSYFIDKPTLFANFHSPNSLGHVVLAELWFDHLTGSQLAAQRFLLGDLTNPSNNAQQNLLEVGNRAYVNGDDSVRLDSIPAALAEAIWVMQGNLPALGDWGGASFTVDRPVTVYVAYDTEATPPQWLTSGFRPVDGNLTAAGGHSWRLYQADFGAGTIELGANNADGANGRMNYLIAVVPQ